MEQKNICEIERKEFLVDKNQVSYNYAYKNIFILVREEKKTISQSECNKLFSQCMYLFT